MRKIIINSIHITEGFFKRDIDFSLNTNLITSEGVNSTGKTTLIRLLLYGLGYPIPSTKGINFKKCATKIGISINGESIELIRENDIIITKENNIETFFSLPTDINSVQKKIFGDINIDIIDNLLGTFYIDQDRGWTLLNRGVVISDIRFNIEKLVRGISNRSAYDLEIQLASIKKEILKYKQMLKIGEYQTENLKEESFLLNNDTNLILENKIMSLGAQKQQISSELKRTEMVINKNVKFKKFIENMNLTVVSKDGEEISVNEQTLVGFSDNHDIQRMRAKMLANQIANLNKQIDTLEKNIYEKKLENSQYSDSLFKDIQKTPTLIDKFDNRLASVPVDIREAEKAISTLNEQRKEIELTIDEKTKINNVVVESLNKYILLYAAEFGVEEYIMHDGVFTGTLKKLSGTIYHKVVFSFRLAYIKAVEEYVFLNTPIIIDSPRGREMSEDNINDTLKVLKRDFSNHQIIIASINKLDIFDNAHNILIKERLISE